MTTDPLSVNKSVAGRLFEEAIDEGRLDVLDDIVADDGRDRADAERWSAGREGSDAWCHTSPSGMTAP